MKRFEYKILDAAVIEPHRESEEFDLKYEVKLEKSDELDNLFEENSILSKFKHKRYIVHLTHKNIEEKKELIKQVLQKAHDNK